MSLQSICNTPKLQNTPGKISKRADSAVEVVQNSMVDFLDAPGQAAYYKQKFAQLAKLRETDVEKELDTFKEVAQERIDLLEAKLEALEKKCAANNIDTTFTQKVPVTTTPKKAVAAPAPANHVDVELEKELDDYFCKVVFYEKMTGMKVDEIKDDVVRCTFNDTTKFSLTFVEDEKVEYRIGEDENDFLPGFLKSDIKFGVDSLPKILGNIYFKLFGVNK